MNNQVINYKKKLHHMLLLLWLLLRLLGKFPSGDVLRPFPPG